MLTITTHRPHRPHRQRSTRVLAMPLVLAALLAVAPIAPFARAETSAAAAPAQTGATAAANRPAGPAAAEAEPVATAQAMPRGGAATAEAGAIDARAVDAAAGPHELSPLSMFMAADIVVKVVMSLLALASLASWTVLIAKSAELIGAGRTLRAALRRAATARSLDEARAAADERSVFARFLAAAELEAQLSRDVAGAAGAAEGIKERAASAFAEITRGEARSIRRGLGLLATVGSVAPFVGLFGTVWGIMNSFIGISRSQTTNLAVVAPGIAEALLATAIGLVAAIPAVVIYNHFSRKVRGHLDLVAAAAGAAGRLLSRDLDRRRDGRGAVDEHRFAAAAE